MCACARLSVRMYERLKGVTDLCSVSSLTCERQTVRRVPLIRADVPYAVTHARTLVRPHMPPSQVRVTRRVPLPAFSRRQHLRFPQSQLSPPLTVTTAMLSLWVTNSRGHRGAAGDKDKSICVSNLLYMEWGNRRGGIGKACR